MVDTSLRLFLRLFQLQKLRQILFGNSGKSEQIKYLEAVYIVTSYSIPMHEAMDRQEIFP